MQQAMQDPNAQGQQFRCEQCGGVLLYDPGTTGMKCKHCKAAGSPQMLAPIGGGPREIPIAQGLQMSRRGLGMPVQAVQCNECGATVQLAPNERAGKCVYCASPMVVATQTDGLLSPESLVPFLVPQDRAIDSYKAWLKGLWFRPNDLSRMAKLEEIFGVYVPFWTFDADVHSQWSAERGWNYQETEEYFENGERRTRTVTKTRWEPASGWRRDHYDDVLVCGSKGIPESLVDKFSTFDTQRLVGYSPGYLSGWRAEAYAIDLPNAWTKGQQKIASEQERRCGGDVGGDTHRGLQVTNNFGNETFKHVLLPIYVAAYRYNDKPFQVLVNGQTAEVVGKAPWSFWKIFLTVLLVLAIVGGIIAIAQSGKSSGGSSSGATHTTQPVKTTPVVPGKKK